MNKVERYRLNPFLSVVHDSKGFEICTAGLEFELGHALLVKTWNS
jgi:hypothetical protein